MGTWLAKPACCGFSANQVHDDIDIERTNESRIMTKQAINLQKQKTRNNSCKSQYVNRTHLTTPIEGISSINITDDASTFGIDTKTMSIIMGLNPMTPTSDDLTPTINSLVDSPRSSTIITPSDICTDNTPNNRVLVDAEMYYIDDSTNDTSSYSDEIFESESNDLDELRIEEYIKGRSRLSSGASRMSHLMREQSKNEWTPQDMDDLEHEMKQQLDVLRRESVSSMSGIKRIKKFNLPVDIDHNLLREGSAEQWDDMDIDTKTEEMQKEMQHLSDFELK